MILDPFVGTGRVLDGARGAGHKTWGYDIVDRGARHPRQLIAYEEHRRSKFATHQVVTNPPFGIVDRLLVEIADQLAGKAALFLPLAYLAGKAKLLDRCPLARVLVCTPRPAAPPPGAQKRGGGMVDFAVFVFESGRRPGTWRGGWLRKNGAP